MSKNKDNVIHLAVNNDDREEPSLENVWVDMPPGAILLESETDIIEPNELLEQAKSADLSEVVVIGLYKNALDGQEPYVGSSEEGLERVNTLLDLGKAYLIDIIRGKD